jgi:hypothetical protein
VTSAPLKPGPVQHTTQWRPEDRDSVLRSPAGVTSDFDPRSTNLAGGLNRPRAYRGSGGSIRLAGGHGPSASPASRARRSTARRRLASRDWPRQPRDEGADRLAPEPLGAFPRKGTTKLHVGETFAQSVKGQGGPWGRTANHEAGLLQPAQPRL